MHYLPQRKNSLAGLLFLIKEMPLSSAIYSRLSPHRTWAAPRYALHIIIRVLLFTSVNSHLHTILPFPPSSTGKLCGWLNSRENGPLLSPLLDVHDTLSICPAPSWFLNAKVLGVVPGAHPELSLKQEHIARTNIKIMR